MATAKNRQIDIARRAAVFRIKQDELGHETAVRSGFAQPAPVAGGLAVDDDVLRLIFTTCHPMLSQESQVALTLRMVAGLKTDEIARALLASEQAIGQRISRAKRTLADAGSPFELPQENDLTPRLSAVLAVIYLIYNEGYSATSGEDWMRLDLAADALRMGRMLETLAPDQAEVHGLAALMELQSSRASARTDREGHAIPLFEQDRSSWDRTLIERGLVALERALATPGPKGQYTLQAQIAACHARAESSEQTDWREIAALYAVLAELTDSPIVELNRALAVGFAGSPADGLELLAEIGGDPLLRDYPHFYGARGELLERARRFDEAAECFARAAESTTNAREREVFARRASAAAASRSS